MPRKTKKPSLFGCALDQLGKEMSGLGLQSLDITVHTSNKIKKSSVMIGC